jgi:hypothetical protein
VNAASATAEQQPGKRWRYLHSWSLRWLAAIASLAIGFSAAYLPDARLDGKVLYSACACGLTPCTVRDGKVILTVTLHDWPAGTVLATTEIKDRVCTLRRIGKNGILQPAERLEVDHLGAKYYDDENGSRPVYVIVADNWKLCPAAVFWRVERLFR